MKQQVIPKWNQYPRKAHLRAQLLAQVVLLAINARLSSLLSYYWCHCMRFHSSSYERDLTLFPLQMSKMSPEALEQLIRHKTHKH